MTTDQTNDTDGDLKLVEAAEAIMRRRVEDLKRAREEQPTLLAEARLEADEARGWSLIEEPWETHIVALPAYNSSGERTGDSLTLPNITAKEMYGARLAFDMLDCGEDFDRIDEVQSRYFKMVNGDPGLMFLVAMSALSTLSGVVVPQILDQLETQASDYTTRVELARARTRAWNGRVDEIRATEETL
ncbi:MAG: hypothetical protein WA622_27005 [Mycobacterium sp.]|uniref:hypothetical protein n=1 Tax=Mycobacterium sp. TaxID=1785 RepID=UPI003C8E62C4